MTPFRLTNAPFDPTFFHSPFSFVMNIFTCPNRWRGRSYTQGGVTSVIGRDTLLLYVIRYRKAPVLASTQNGFWCYSYGLQMYISKRNCYSVDSNGNVAQELWSIPFWTPIRRQFTTTSRPTDFYILVSLSLSLRYFISPCVCVCVKQGWH